MLISVTIQEFKRAALERIQFKFTPSGNNNNYTNIFESVKRLQKINF